MAEMTIQLRRDPATGKQDIVVSLRSDDDALPHEHEELHRRLVEKLVEGGLLTADDVGSLIVEREEEESQGATTATSDEAPVRRAQSEG